MIRLNQSFVETHNSLKYTSKICIQIRKNTVNKRIILYKIQTYILR